MSCCRAHDLVTRLVVVDDKKPEDEIRADFVDNLKRGGDYVIVNYRREEVGQRGGGHISPLGAYDAESDSVLVHGRESRKRGLGVDAAYDARQGHAHLRYRGEPRVCSGSSALNSSVAPRERLLSSRMAVSRHDSAPYASPCRRARRRFACDLRGRSGGERASAGAGRCVAWSVHKSAAVSKRFMVAAAHPLATDAGYAILRQGGSAVDAAIAVQLVLGLVEPQNSGLGGGAFMLVHAAKRTS